MPPSVGHEHGVAVNAGYSEHLDPRQHQCHGHNVNVMCIGIVYDDLHIWRIK